MPEVKNEVNFQHFRTFFGLARRREKAGLDTRVALERETTSLFSI